MADFPFFWHLMETIHQSTISHPVPTSASGKPEGFIISIQCKSLQKTVLANQKFLNFSCRYNFKRINNFAERTDTFEHIPQDMAQIQLCELRTKIKQRAFGKVTAHTIFRK